LEPLILIDLELGKILIAIPMLAGMEAYSRICLQLQKIDCLPTTKKTQQIGNWKEKSKNFEYLILIKDFFSGKRH